MPVPTIPLRQVWPLLGSVVASMVLAGCETPTGGSAASAKITPQAQRAAEQTTALATLPATTRQEVLEGRIARGQAREIVFVALGKPDVVTSTADGRVLLWTYRTYFPPETAEQKKEFVKEIQRRSNRTDPLEETFEFWRLNANPRAALLEKGVSPRALGQSAADYAKYLRDRQFAGPGAVFLDKTQLQEYDESLYLPPVPEAVPVQRDVVFLDGVVHDAIVNETGSAFAPPTPVKP